MCSAKTPMLVHCCHEIKLSRASSFSICFSAKRANWVMHCESSAFNRRTSEKVSCEQLESQYEISFHSVFCRNFLWLRLQTSGFVEKLQDCCLHQCRHRLGWLDHFCQGTELPLFRGLERLFTVWMLGKSRKMNSLYCKVNFLNESLHSSGVCAPKGGGV